MLQSQLFTKTRREAPKDEEAKNAKLLIRAGYINKEMAGVYSFLPLGLRVLEKINRIIREEMNAAGGQEVFLAALQDKTTWEKTNRWDDKVVDNWFKTELKSGGELGLGFTHEEPLTQLMKNHIRSHRDLPAYPYQIQTKFRNELRAKSGIMRGREFLMKDLYSFSKNEEEHEAFYERMKEAYANVFSRVGIGERTFLTFASGGTFCKYSHEYQMTTDAGEDMIYVDHDKRIAVNKEVLTDAVLHDLGLKKEDLKGEKAVEVGNIFTLGTRFSEAFELKYKNESGKDELVFMGSYGIGPSRLMGAVVEALADEDGLVWPEEIAPFKAHVVLLGKEEKTKKEAEFIYHELKNSGVETLYDDREGGAGEKLGDADLIGIPYRIIVSDKSLEKGGIELKARTESDTRILSRDELLKFFKK